MEPLAVARRRVGNVDEVHDFGAIEAADLHGRHEGAAMTAEGRAAGFVAGEQPRALEPAAALEMAGQRVWSVGAHLRRVGRCGAPSASGPRGGGDTTALRPCGGAAEHRSAHAERAGAAARTGLADGAVVVPVRFGGPQHPRGCAPVHGRRCRVTPTVELAGGSRPVAIPEAARVVDLIEDAVVSVAAPAQH